MKRIFFHCFIVIIVALLFVQTAFAQEASPSARNTYQLPYAGLLPDSPLYFLKAFRDRVVELLISDPLKKSEFDLLSADKRLSMGIALYDKKKYELSESTISKGENYFEDGVKNLESAKKEGRQIDPSLLVSYDLSTKKHREILQNLIAKSSGTIKNKLVKNLERVNRFIELVNGLKL